MVSNPMTSPECGRCRDRFGGVTAGLVIIAVAVVLALGVGAWRRLTDGTFRGTRPVPGATAPEAAEPAGPIPGGGVLADTEYAESLGERATLLQFSTAFCSPCRATRRTLAEVAQLVPGVAHVEVDAEDHLDLVRRVGVLRTPTTLVLDADGREVTRAAGAPTKPAVIASLDWLASDS